MTGRDEGFTWIADSDALAPWIDRLRQQPRIAVDTESNSMHAYRERICLVQISTPQVDLLIDGLHADLRLLEPLLAAADLEKVMHGADYDVLSFKRAFGSTFANLFDTAIAARVLGWPKFGLAALLEQHFGHRANKKFQRYDWGRRPLSPEALAYARYDTHYLLALRDLAATELEERGRIEYFEHACVRQTLVEPRERPFDPEAFWKLKGVRELDPVGRAIVRALFVFRDGLAQTMDRPVFRVMPDAALVQLACDRPSTEAELGKVKGMPRPVLARNAKAVLQVIEAATHDEPPPRPPRREPTPRPVAARFDRLRAWRRDEAARLGMEPEIVLAKQSLMGLAEANPQTPEQLQTAGVLDEWERNRYGEPILAVLTHATVSS